MFPLVFGFTPLVVGIALWLAISLIQTAFDLPAILDIENVQAYDGAQRAAVTMIDILWPMFVVCYFFWLPFLLTGLIFYIFPLIRTRYAKD